ncbi:MAG: M20 family metallo-hydrolase [Spirochaetota bacterium]
MQKAIAYFKRNTRQLANDVVDMQRALVPLKAFAPENGGVGEAKKAAYVDSILQSLSVRRRSYPVKDKRVPGGIRPNIAGVVPGKDASRTMWTIAHLDVVPEGDKRLWNTDPYTLTVKGDTLIGRGVTDNNFAIAAGLVLLKVLTASRTVPPVNTGAFFFADEEVGSRYGIRAVLSRYKGVFGEQDIVYVPDMSSPSGADMEIAEKSMLWLTVHITGKQTHGSRPDHGINAHRAAAYFVTAMDELTKKRFGKRNRDFDLPITTIEPTKVEPNVGNINTIPGEHSLSFDCRVLPGYSTQSVHAAFRVTAKRIESRFGVRIRLAVENRHDALKPISKKCDALRYMKGAVIRTFHRPMRVYGVGGGTCAYFLRERGIEAVVCGKGKETAHTPNESVSIKDILQYVELYLNVLDGIGK